MMDFKLWLETNEMVMPKLFEKLKQLEGKYSGVHFSRSDQLSFYYSPFHHDPIGIYVFPKDYVLEGKLKKNQGFASFPYAFLIEPTAQAKVLNLDMDYAKAEELLEKMGIDKNLLYDKSLNHIHPRRSNQNTSGHKFWDVLEYIRESEGLSKNVSWNVLFSKTGYNAIYDPGLSIVHPAEPAQVIYLSHSAYKVVDVIKNTNILSLSTQFASFFPDFRIYKQKSGWSNEKFLNLKKDKISIHVYTDKYNPNRLTVKVYGFKKAPEWIKDIDSKQDLAELVDEIKTFMQDSEKQPDRYDFDNPIVKDISKFYNLKINPETPYFLSKTYRDKTSFVIRYSPYKQSINLEIKGSPSIFGSYLYNSESNSLNTIEETIQELISGLKQQIQQDIEDPKSYYKWAAPYALKFVDFLEKKVFVKRSQTESDVKTQKAV
jgi:hypothetical protein